MIFPTPNAAQFSRNTRSVLGIGTPLYAPRTLSATVWDENVMKP